MIGGDIYSISGGASTSTSRSGEKTQVGFRERVLSSYKMSTNLTIADSGIAAYSNLAKGWLVYECNTSYHPTASMHLSITLRYLHLSTTI